MSKHHSDDDGIGRRTLLSSGTLAIGGLGLTAGTTGAAGAPRLELVGHTTLGVPDGGISNMDVREDLGLAATGSFVYGDTDVHVVDIADQTDPERTATISAGPTGYVNDVAFHPTEPWVFTANEGGADAGWGIVDVSDPADPTLLGAHTVEGGAGVHTIVAFDEAHVIVSGTGRGIVIYDVTEPTNPTEIGSFQATDETVGTLSPEDPEHAHSGYVHDTRVRGEYAFLAHWDHGLYVLDLSDPSAPSVAAAFDYEDESADVPLRNAHHAFPHPERDICLVGEEVGYGEPGYKHIVEFDVETGETELLSSFQFPQHATQPTGNQGFRWTGHFSDWGVGDQQDVLFSGDYKAGVQTFDLSDPAAPERIDQYYPTEGVGEVRSAAPARALTDVPFTWGANTDDSEYVYVSDFNTGVYVLELARFS